MEVFRRSALRATPQRFAVLDYLMHSPEHATADQIFQAVNASDPRVSRATVYNNLHTLIRAGLVREVLLEGKAARFDANLERHHHFVCEDCGRLEDVAWFDLPALTRRSPSGGRVITSYQILFRGLCAGCSSHAEPVNGRVHSRSARTL
jgi:Fur family transcriptional regulator, peroxide stress response regulator